MCAGVDDNQYGELTLHGTCQVPRAACRTLGVSNGMMQVLCLLRHHLGIHNDTHFIQEKSLHAGFMDQEVCMCVGVRKEVCMYVGVRKEECMYVLGRRYVCVC